MLASTRATTTEVPVPKARMRVGYSSGAYTVSSGRSYGNPFQLPTNVLPTIYTVNMRHDNFVVAWLSSGLTTARDGGCQAMTLTAVKISPQTPRPMGEPA